MLILPTSVVAEIERERTAPQRQEYVGWIEEQPNGGEKAVAAQRSSERTFNVGYHSDLVKFVNLVAEADGRILNVRNCGDMLLSGGYDIEYLCDREIDMEVLC